MDYCITDLNSFSPHNLSVMANYFGVESRLPKTLLIKQLAKYILATHHKASMEKGDLPYGGDLSLARKKHDVPAIKEITAWRESMKSKTLKEEEVIAEATDCSNDVDYITQEKWVKKPDI